mgnify:CR=1 FL=1
MPYTIIFKFASNISHIFPIIFGRRTKPILWWYTVMCLFFDLGTFLLKKSNLHVPGIENTFLIVEFCLISVFYRQLYRVNATYYATFAIGILLFLIHTIFIRPYNTSIPFDVFRVNLSAGAIFYLYYIIYSIAGFYKQIKEPEQDFIEHSSFFWVNVAFLVYASGVFFIFLFAQIIEVQDYNMISLLWNYLFCSLNIIKNIFLAKALAVDNGSVKR